MDTKLATQQIRLQEWSQIIKARCDSGETIKESRINSYPRGSIPLSTKKENILLKCPRQNALLESEQ